MSSKRGINAPSITNITLITSFFPFLQSQSSHLYMAHFNILILAL